MMEYPRLNIYVLSKNITEGKYTAMDFPAKPRKPALINKRPSSDEIEEYVNKNKQYEEDVVQYKLHKEAYNTDFTTKEELFIKDLFSAFFTEEEENKYSSFINEMYYLANEFAQTNNKEVVVETFETLMSLYNTMVIILERQHDD